MICDLTNSIISLFGDTFLVAYFLQVSNENIVQVSIYYIIIYTLLGIASLVLGNLMKRMPSKRIIIYRVGIIVKSIFVLLIVLLKENINQYFMIFAIFYGITEALYWAAHDVMNIEIVDNTNRKQYMTTKRILEKLIDIIFPIILGTSIELTSFINISFYIFILTLIQIIISFNIDSNKFVTGGSKDKYSLKYILYNYV